MSFTPTPAPPGLPPPPPYPNDQPKGYYIPPRLLFYGDADPAPHTSPAMVLSLLLGNDLSAFVEPMPTNPAPGTVINGCYYGTLVGTLIPLVIQAKTNALCAELRGSWDWAYKVWMTDGTGSPELTLPDRNVRDVLACFIRVLPSNVWYSFVRPRKTGGEEYWNIGGVVGYPIAVETWPTTPLSAATEQGTVYPTGIEDADLLVDVRRRTVKIPPRVLYAGVNVPLWNYTFNPGPLNIELHYTMGFPPTKYLDGTALQFQAATPPSVVTPVYMTNPTTGSGIDWSSNMPTDVRFAVARMTANHILTMKWKIDSGGVTNLSVDGASEGYGSEPYGGFLTKEDEALVKSLAPKSVRMVV